MRRVIKRSGQEVSFNEKKPLKAIQAANAECGSLLRTSTIEKIIGELMDWYKEQNRQVHVEEIQDWIERRLTKENYDVGRAYIRYRYERQINREGFTDLEKKILAIVDDVSEEATQENANKNVRLNSTKRDYIAGTVSRQMVRKMHSKEFNAACDEGAIHDHDQDYTIEHMFNCCLVNLKDMLENGTVINGVKIETPHTFSTACNVSTQITVPVASNQYGGQSISLAHITKYVDATRNYYRNLGFENEQLESLIADDIKRGVQIIQYQINTFATSNGQAPFVTLFMYLGECENELHKQDTIRVIKEVLKQRMRGVKNKDGEYEPVTFPKLILVESDELEEKYSDLEDLAAECISRTMVPDIISEKKMFELKDGHCFPVMGCRSALSPWSEDPEKYYGRFNKGVVSVNLPYVALKSKCDVDKFWKLLDYYCELAYEGLVWKYERLRGVSSDCSPVHFNYGALARLPEHATIDSLLVGGYSTSSLGYAGCAETIKALYGETILSDSGKEHQREIMQFLNDKCDEWNERIYLGFGVYGTPLESTTDKFARALKKFPKIEGVNDHGYVTNSYHYPVTEKVDAFTKLKDEAVFQDLSTGGAISYVELPDMSNNLEAVKTLMHFIRDNIMYAEMNLHINTCHVCGGHDLRLDNVEGKLLWTCHDCGNRDHDRMTTIVRVCGYLSKGEMNQGRLGDINDREFHL